MMRLMRGAWCTRSCRACWKGTGAGEARCVAAQRVQPLLSRVGAKLLCRATVHLNGWGLQPVSGHTLQGPSVHSSHLWCTHVLGLQHLACTARPGCAVLEPIVLDLQAEAGGTGKQTVEQPAKPAGPAKPLRPADGTANPTGQQRPQPAASSTLFVRGLPPDATPEQLSLRMKTFGVLRGCRSVPVLCQKTTNSRSCVGYTTSCKQCSAGGCHCLITAYLITGGAQHGRHLTLMGVSCSCRLVMNKATNKPKGTAFVEFKDPAGAAKAAKASADARCVSEGWLQHHISFGQSRRSPCCAMHIQMQLLHVPLCQAPCMHSWCRPKGGAGPLPGMPSCSTPTVSCRCALKPAPAAWLQPCCMSTKFRHQRSDASSPTHPAQAPSCCTVQQPPHAAAALGAI